MFIHCGSEPFSPYQADTCNERRRQKRRTFNREVNVLRPGTVRQARRNPAWGINISSGGIRIVTKNEMNAGEQVAVQLHPNKPALSGKVAWVKSRHDGCIAGIAFAA